ncbi:MAG: hypothetical protein ABEH40_01835 [Haloferacaceae archaeon]
MPGDDGPLAALDPESVSGSAPDRFATVPRLVLGLHLAVAAILFGFAALAAADGTPVQAVVVGSIGGMVVVAGWAAGRLAARR